VHRGQIYEKSLGILLLFAMGYVECLQILDATCLIELIASVLSCVNDGVRALPLLVQQKRQENFVNHCGSSLGALRLCCLR